jgi:hypothetical protein
MTLSIGNFDFQRRGDRTPYFVAFVRQLLFYLEISMEQ